jgi:hypothetical protein
MKDSIAPPVERTTPRRQKLPVCDDAYICDLEGGYPGDMARRVLPVVLLVLGVALSPRAASPKPPYVSTTVAQPLKEIEAKAKALSQGNDPAVRFDAFMKWLGLSLTCPTSDCKTIAPTKWLTANLDLDADDEKVLAITTLGGGTCSSASLEVIVFDSTASGWVAAAHTSLRVSGGATPTTEVLASAVHSAKVRDLVLRGDGQCTGSPREQELRVMTFENGRLEELVASSEHVGTGLLSHAFAGAPPVTLELTDQNGKTKLWFDESAFLYDALRSYDDALKSTVTKDDDPTLSTKDCAGPLGGSLAAECKLDGNAKVQVLVQLGKPIGLTVTSTPKKASFERCMRKRIAKLVWPSLAGATGCLRTFATK